MPSANFKQSPVAAQIVESFTSAALNEDTCRRSLLPLIRPDMICPTCRVSYSHADIERALSGRDVICGSCRRKASPRSGTILDGVHCGFREVLLVAVLLHWEVRRQEIAKCTGISDDTVRRLAKRLGGIGA